ncbi:uncharacterized protein LOC142355945 [Convolutriloba macropyga]|uniref:uncharacterized protein LOC142336854 n=1 Tax=Convolutriloba macropyga TaxID=536237 RepID=UPI003F51C423
MYLYHPDKPDDHCDYPVLNRNFAANEIHCHYHDGCQHLKDDLNCVSFNVCNRKPYAMTLTSLSPDPTNVQFWRMAYWGHEDYKVVNDHFFYPPNAGTMTFTIEPVES